jgi:hypothetical protein
MVRCTTSCEGLVTYFCDARGRLPSAERGLRHAALLSVANVSSRPVRHKFPQFRDLAAYLREVCHHYRPSQFRGRRECRMPDAPAASCALWVVSMHTSIHSESPESPGIPRAMVYGLYRALPGDRLSCHRRRRSCLHRLDTSVGVSGPHVFAVRLKYPRQEHHPRPPQPAPR